MAQDYAKADLARSFAEQRGISVREKVAEIVRQVPEKTRSIFASFRPQARALDSAAPAPSAKSDIQQAVECYARAAADVDRMREQQLPVLTHQREALGKAGAALEVIRPHARADLESAFGRHPELVRPAAQGNSQAAIRAMQIEAEIRSDPHSRAGRFVEDWQRLQRQRDGLSRTGEHGAARKLSSEMGTMAKSLERDAQVESILRTRKTALGIDARSVRSIGRELAEIASFGRDRSRGIGIGM